MWGAGWGARSRGGNTGVGCCGGGVCEERQIGSSAVLGCSSDQYPTLGVDRGPRQSNSGGGSFLVDARAATGTVHRHSQLQYTSPPHSVTSSQTHSSSIRVIAHTPSPFQSTPTLDTQSEVTAYGQVKKEPLSQKAYGRKSKEPVSQKPTG